MSLMLIAAIQAAAPAAPERMLRSNFDLAEVRQEDGGRLALGASRGCGPGNSGEILVCGRRPSREEYPMEEMERLYAPEPIVDEMRLGGNMTGRASTSR